MGGDRVVDAGADSIFLTQGTRESIPVLRDADRVLVEDVGGAGCHVRDGDPAQVGAEVGGVALAFGGPGVNLGQLDATDGGVNVGHAVVEADDLVLVALLHPLVARQAHPPDEGGVAAGDHPSLAAGHVLGRVEGEGGEGTEGADRPPVQARPVGLRGVLEEHEASLAGDRVEGVEGRGVTVEVNRHDGPGAGADGGGDRGGREREGERIDVREHGGCPRDGNGVGRRCEREGGDDHFVSRADPGRQQPQVQGGGPGVEGDRSRSRHDLAGEFLFERLDLGSLRDHPGAHDACDRADLLLPDEGAGRRNERSCHCFSLSRSSPRPVGAVAASPRGVSFPPRST